MTYFLPRIVLATSSTIDVAVHSGRWTMRHRPTAEQWHVPTIRLSPGRSSYVIKSVGPVPDWLRPLLIAEDAEPAPAAPTVLAQLIGELGL